ncbi:beta/alpha barrel domain-containing protein, partial [Staphylococcus epidermidis]|uniref:hypothetical protein n=1 Tax=Staphylococcus epidermidis TaxID=1282 RepID=UPI0011A70236
RPIPIHNHDKIPPLKPLPQPIQPNPSKPIFQLYHPPTIPNPKFNQAQHPISPTPIPTLTPHPLPPTQITHPQINHIIDHFRHPTPPAIQAAFHALEIH